MDTKTKLGYIAIGSFILFGCLGAVTVHFDSAPVVPTCSDHSNCDFIVAMPWWFAAISEETLVIAGISGLGWLVACIAKPN